MLVYITEIQPFFNLRGIKLVTEKRRERILSYVRVEDKARCLVAGLFMRHVCGVTDDSLLTYGENGKPYLKDGGMYFNISHSGDYVVLVAAEREIGVDIEKITPYSSAVAARCFTPDELEWLKLQGTDEAFCRLWTAKESIMKKLGLGLVMPPESFCVLPLNSSAKSIGGNLYFLDWFNYNGHIICRALEGGDEKTEMVYIKANALK